MNPGKLSAESKVIDGRILQRPELDIRCNIQSKHFSEPRCSIGGHTCHSAEAKVAICEAIEDFLASGHDAE